MTQTVFRGPHAIANYLNPDNHAAVPLVELPPTLNPYHSAGLRVYLKLMHHLPLGNVKSLPAFSMLESIEQEQKGATGSLHSLVEARSGNTVFSLGVTARATLGVDTTLAIASHEVERGKLNLLRLLGTSVRVVEEDICPDPRDPTSAPNLAKAQAREAGWVNPAQYENAANPAAHQRWTGPQIWEQTEGMISILTAGLGTCGTLVGTSAFLKERQPSLHTIGAVRAPNNPVPGVRTEGLLREVQFPWQDAVDSLVAVGTVEAYRQSADCCRHGLLVGPSAGFALASLYQQIESWQQSGSLDQYRNESGEIVAVVISPDGPLAYLEEYFRYLPESYFPAIENEHLLRKPESAVTTNISEAAADISALNLAPETLHRMLNNGDEVMLLDIRDAFLYEDHHIDGAVWLPFSQLQEHLEIALKSSAITSSAPVVFVCQYGAQSASLAQRAQALGYVQARSLAGGMITWSKRDLPRQRPERCVARS